MRSIPRHRPAQPAGHWTVLVAICAGAALLAAPASSPAQDKTEPKPAPKSKLAEPKNYSLTMSDGLKLYYTIYPGGEGKETVPVVLLHAFNGKRGDLKGLAEYLQEGGYAVVVPDIRGHGDSTTIEPPNGKKAIILNPNRLGPPDFKKIVAIDLEALKAVLVKENNKGTCNIKKLCVIGVEMGATLAVNWAAQDWSWQDVGNQRQGRDIRGVILAAPHSTLKSVPVAPALLVKGLKEEVLYLVLAGNKDPKERTYEATKSFLVQLEKAIMIRSKPGEKVKPPSYPRLTIKEFPTTLQGQKLLDNAQVKVGQGMDAKLPREIVDEFILKAISERKGDEWEQRGG